MMKSYENVIYNRLQHALENDDVKSYDDFTGNNYAYRQKTGVQDAYREFEDILSQYRETKPEKENDELAVVSIDLASAFDTVKWDSIFDTLEK
jgi:hypothetical protein